jgi:hypothetical protein
MPPPATESKTLQALAIPYTTHVDCDSSLCIDESCKSRYCVYYPIAEIKKDTVLQNRAFGGGISCFCKQVHPNVH